MFAVLFVCSLTTGGTVVTLLMLQLPERQEMDLMMMQEQRARQEADVARQEAEVARQAADEARRRLERELEAARKNAENGP